MNRRPYKNRVYVCMYTILRSNIKFRLLGFIDIIYRNSCKLVIYIPLFKIYIAIPNVPGISSRAGKKDKL